MISGAAIPPSRDRGYSNSGKRRSVRQHALLQDRLSETQTTRRPGIEAFNLDRDPRRFEKNFRRVIAAPDQAQRDWNCRAGFCHSGADIFTARSFRRRIFFWRRMHRATGHFRRGLSGGGEPGEGAMIRKSEPSRDNDYDNRPTAHHSCGHTAGHVSKLHSIADSQGLPLSFQIFTRDPDRLRDHRVHVEIAIGPKPA